MQRYRTRNPGDGRGGFGAQGWRKAPRSARLSPTVRTVDANVSLKLVHASRGKITRAEPISAIFEQRRAHLVGTFPELEDQMATYAAGSASSPDRLDSMVWSLTELMVDRLGLA